MRYLTAPSPLAEAMTEYDTARARFVEMLNARSFESLAQARAYLDGDMARALHRLKLAASVVHARLNITLSRSLLDWWNRKEWHIVRDAYTAELARYDALDEDVGNEAVGGT